MKPGKGILSAVHIRGPELMWVIAAHAYAILVPLALCVAVYYHWDYLVATTYNPFLFFMAACLLSAGSAFEVAQNTIDNWYLTSDTASANGLGVCDFLFYWLITMGQAVTAMAIGGDAWWVVSVGLAAVLALPILYFLKGPYFAPLTIANLLVIGLAYQAFGDPTIFLQLLLAAATIYFFEALLRTGAQLLHGFTTSVASSGAWFLIWAFSNGSAGTPNSWAFVVAFALAALVAGLALWPLLRQLPASTRITGDAECRSV